MILNGCSRLLPAWRTQLKHRIYFALLGVALLVPSVSLLAHHSPSAIFNMKNKVSLKGTVTKVDWVNPHIVLFMDVKGDDGNVVNWKFESNPPRWFTKVGVARADFAAAMGQTVMVEIVAAIDGSKYGYLQKITFPNGNEISLVEGQKEEIRP
jgi:hypothetical protein